MFKQVVDLLTFVLLVIAFSVISAPPVYLLWNALVPELFGLPQVSFLQAWGLMILSNCLFKNASIK